MKKKRIGIIAGCAVFALLLALSLGFLTRLVTPASNRFLWYTYASGILGEEEDSLDYVVVGSSNATAGFAPMAIYGEYGCAGYVCGETLETTPKTYLRLKEIFKKQSPKYVIFETDAFYDTQQVSNAEAAESYLETWLEYVWKYPKYHNQWKMVDPKDPFPDKDHTWTHVYRGETMNFDLGGFGETRDYMAYSTDLAPMRATCRAYFKKCVRLCRENGAEPVVLSLPCAKYWTYPRHEYVKSLAQSAGAEYIDLNCYLDAMDFDGSLYYRDDGVHLNSPGAKTATLFFASLMNEKYPGAFGASSLTDTGYEHWNGDYQKYIVEFTP